MTAHVLVVGDIVTDVVALVAGPIEHASDTGAEITVTGGGAGGNTSAWLVAAGVHATLCAVVGADQAGAARLAELAAHGVTCAVRTVPGERTGTVVVIAERSERTMLADRGANLLLSVADVDAALEGVSERCAGDAVHLHLSGYPLLDAASRPAAQHALRVAASRGMTTSVDAASAGPLRRAGGSTFLSWVRGTDVLFANLDEARALLDRDGSAEDLARALASVVRIAVVKSGRGGAVSSSGDGTFAVSAVPTRVVDATGAGDAFAAGYLAAWLANASQAEASQAKPSQAEAKPSQAEAKPSQAEALAAGARWGASAVAVVGARPPTG